MSLELLKFENAIEEFRKLNPDFQTQAIMTFLWIARGHKAAQGFREKTEEKINCYMTVSQIAEKMRLSDASASRNVSNLSNRKNRYGKDGHGLVQLGINPFNSRYSYIELTPKGEDFMKRIESIIGGHTPLVDLKEARSSVTNVRRGIDPKTGWSAGMRETIKEKMDQALKGENIEGASKDLNNEIRQRIGAYKASGASWGEIQELITMFLQSERVRKETLAKVGNPQAEKFYRESIEKDGEFLGIKPEGFFQKLVGKPKTK